MALCNLILSQISEQTITNSVDTVETTTTSQTVIVPSETNKEINPSDPLNEATENDGR